MTMCRHDLMLDAFWVDRCAGAFDPRDVVGTSMPITGVEEMCCLSSRSMAEPSWRVRFGTNLLYTRNSISVLECPS